jgi:hypothetical protein
VDGLPRFLFRMGEALFRGRWARAALPIGPPPLVDTLTIWLTLLQIYSIPRFMSSPADFHPSLTPERMAIVAHITTVAVDSVVTSKESRSDEWWGVACHAYNRLLSTFKTAAGEHEWLEFAPEQGLGFTLRIGGVPIRTQRESEKAKPVLAGERTAWEQIQISLPFQDEDMPTSYLRLEYEGPRSKALRRVVLKRIESATDAVLDVWTLWPDEASVAPPGGQGGAGPGAPPHAPPPADFELSAEVGSGNGGDADEKAEAG